MRLGLRGKMLLGIISALLISFIAIASVGYVNAKNIIIAEAEKQLVTKNQYMKEKVMKFFLERQTIIQSEEKYIEEFLEKPIENNYENIIKQNIKSHFVTRLSSLKKDYGIVDIYIGYPDGSVDCGSGWTPDDPTWKANERSWYKAAMESKGKQVFTEVYIDSDTKKPVVTLSQVIPGRDGREYGVLALDIELSQLNNLFLNEKIGETGYPFMLDKDGRFLIHNQYAFNEDISKAETIYNISEGSLKEIGEKLIHGSSEILKGYLNGVNKVYYSEKIDGTDFYIVSTLTEQDFTGQLDRLMFTIAIILVFSIVFFISFTFIFIGRITGAIKHIVEAMEQMSLGNLNYKMKKINRKDELSILAKAMNKMQNSVKEIIQGIILEADNVNKAINISNNSISELRENLENASAAVEQLSAGVEETASATMEINTISQEIESAVGTIADKAQEGAMSASEISSKALSLKESSMSLQEEANETSLSIRKAMDAALDKIKEVEKINSLSDVIMQISAQTNLLALNAAIESARAGEAGRGFSIVAEEIRKLSESSKTTVNEIQNAVKGVFEAVNNLADTAKETLTYIETKVLDSYKESVMVGENYDKDAIYINSLVGDLSATSEELLASFKTVSESIEGIAKASNEGAEGTSDIADRVLKIKDRANEVKAQTESVKDSAEHLRELVSAFKI